MLSDTLPANQSSHVSSVCRIFHAVGLSAIDRAEVNVIVLQRMLSPALLDEVMRLSQRSCFRMLAAVAPDRRGKQELAGHLRAFPHLAADLGYWIEVLADLVECCAVGVRLASVDHGMCSRWHVDHVSVRVVSSYAGPGTHFVENADVDRRFLGHTPNGASAESSGVLRPGSLIQAASSGDIVFLKGERWPGNQGGGAVHRSPPGSTACPRLVLTLDPLWN